MSNPASGDPTGGPMTLLRRRLVNHYMPVPENLERDVRLDVDTHVVDEKVLNKFDVMSGRNLKRPWWRIWNAR